MCGPSPVRCVLSTWIAARCGGKYEKVRVPCPPARRDPSDAPSCRGAIRSGNNAGRPDNVRAKALCPLVMARLGCEFMASFSKSSPFWLACFLTAAAPGAFAQQCPPHSHARMVSIPGNLQTAHCWCDVGFENVGGVCLQSAAAMPRRSPAIVRTQSECVADAERQLRADLAKCRSPMVACLKNAGVGSAEAVCAAAALAAASNSSKINVRRAASGCGDKFYQNADVCSATWDECQTNPIKAHSQAIAACPDH